LISSWFRWRRLRKHGIPYRVARLIRWHTINVEDRKLRLLDCGPFTLSVRVTSTDEKVDERFANSRTQDGLSFINNRPNHPAAFAADYTFPWRSDISDGPLFRAKTLEDRYDIFHHHGQLLLVRSWSQALAMRVAIEPRPEHIKLAEIEYDASRYANDDFALQALEFLLKSHCFDMVVPHPLHPKLDPESEYAILSYSFSEFGRRGWHGTFDNAVGVYSSKRYGFSQ
jgi:hypothetical protein